MAQSEILQKGIHLPDVSGECETISFQVKWYLILSPFYMEHNTINCLICSCLWSIFVPLSLSLPHLRKYGGDGGCYRGKTSEKQTQHSFSLWVGEELGRYLLGHRYVVPNICWTKTTAGESPAQQWAFWRLWQHTEASAKNTTQTEPTMCFESF